MKAVSLLILSFTLFIISQGLFIFAGFPNNTGIGNGFDVTAANVWLYCALPFIIAILLAATSLFIIFKIKKFLLSGIILSSIALIIMIAYTIFLFFISSEGWFGTYFNIASIFIDVTVLVLLLLLKKNKIAFSKKALPDQIK